MGKILSKENTLILRAWVELSHLIDSDFELESEQIISLLNKEGKKAYYLENKLGASIIVIEGEEKSTVVCCWNLFDTIFNDSDFYVVIGVDTSLLKDFAFSIETNYYAIRDAFHASLETHTYEILEY